MYLSPIFAAAPGSTHGYDVLDHNQVSRELGGIPALYALGEELVQRDMGLIIDIVPNHVGIGDGANHWWREVLRYGQNSPFAQYFDIDWEAQPQMASGVLVFPILGQPFGAALEAGELRLALEGGDFCARYYEYSLPISPASYPRVAGLPPVELRAKLGDPAALSEFVDLLDQLPGAEPVDCDRLLDRFRRLVLSEPAISAYLEGRLALLNGVVGDPASFDELEAIFRSQFYRLTFWRVSGEELNYRRFFDVNGLAAIRVERDDVFDNVHGLLFELVARGIVTGVRVDHIDGLYDPARYLARLRERLQAAAAPLTTEMIPVYVEKILEADERLPRWPVEGATGYEFMAHVDGLLVDRNHARELTDIYEGVLGEHVRYRDIAYLSRRQVAETLFAGEINVLAFQLHRLAQRHRLHRDNTLRSLRDAIAVTLACFPVYRTYLHEGGPSEIDRRLVANAVGEARMRDASLTDGALAFLAEVLSLEGGGGPPDEMERRVHYRRRFQQISGPVMAKGLEDTTFYRYARLLSMNEVGSDPGRFGVSRYEAHSWFKERASEWPRAMSASSTHDTKRSEDVRARLHVISEIPEEWARQVRAWSRMNRRHLRHLRGEAVPDPNTEYYLYQTLAGTWEGTVTPTYRQRMRDHMTKAIREMKIYTSWLAVDPDYEEATLAFVDSILDRTKAPSFLNRLTIFARRIEGPGSLNALSALILKCTAPGIPDFYQGTELPVFAVTDPDNRRPVDFEAHASSLAGLSRDFPGLRREAKQWLAQRLLRLRSEHPGLFVEGTYDGLEVEGPDPERVFAFSRACGVERLVVVVPRFTMRLRAPGAGLEGSVMDGVTVDMPDGYETWVDALSDREVRGAGTIPVSVLLGDLPFAVLFGTAS